MNETPIVAVSNLTRRFGKKEALAGLSFEITGGAIVGLLGRNGAGKSTLLRILTAQDLQTKGDVRLFGEKPFENARVLSQICLISDKPDYGNLRTISDVLSTYAQLQPRWDASYALQTLERFELTRGLRLKGLSRGMQTALGLTCGMASRAPLTLFDEPSLGLDAVMRERFYDMVLEDYARVPRTFLLSTHLIEEVTRVLQTVVMIDCGKLLLQGNAKALMAEAYTLAGENAQAVFAETGAQLLRTETLEGVLTLSCRGARPACLPAGVTCTPLSLQRLFVLLTDPLQGGEKG
ncbi:MAG: ABC transporter ATP-binding protein [Clostridia bacterium]